MAKVDELRRALEPHTGADVTHTFQRFQESSGSEDPAEFVRYMVEQGLLPSEAAAQVEAELRAGANREPTIIERREPASPAEGWGRRVPSLPPRADNQNLRLQEEIGRGGMGTVFRAEQLELGRPVAFKQLLEGYSDTLRERFMREARITAQLDHPNIVPVHGLEVSPNGKTIGYAMKLVEGKTLRVFLTETATAYERGLPIDEEHALPKRLEHFLKICDALAFAHARGILHRDLKPANFMIGKFNEVYVMDWGIARHIGADDEPEISGESRASAEPDLTEVGEIIGSAPYMSPEQADGRNRELDARADQYALGLILFELVSLRRAINSKTNEEAWALASTGKKAPLEHISKRERIPVELRAIVEKATAYAPDDRYVSVGALAEDVRRYLRGEAVAARPDNVLQKLLRSMSRHRRTTLVVVFGVLALAGITVSWTLYRKAASELAAGQRGEARTAFYIDVALQGRRLDAQFQRMEEALEGLRTSAEWALTGPEPKAADAPIYFDTDFANATSRPADFTSNTSYRWPVSVEHPVVGLSPGTSRAAVLPKVRRLSALRTHIRDMFVAAARDDKTQLSDAEKRDILLQRRGPIDYAYVDLPEGVHYVFPGVDALPPGYDVRTAGFYKISENQHGKRWGSPYIDSTTDEQGDDLVLPCTQGLWSPTGQFLGVAGVEITVTKIVETGLALPGRQTRRTTLVNGDGKKVIDSNDAGKRFQANGKDEGLALFDFDIPEVVTAIRAGSAGLREIRRDGHDVVVSFVRLDVLGWYYVVEVDAATLHGG